MKISILGYGVFGSAMGFHLNNLGHVIYEEEVRDSELILVAVPSYAVREVLSKFKDEILNQNIIICSKGFSEEGELLSVVLGREFPNNKVFFLYGPTLAEGIMKGEFSGMVLAGGQGKEELKKEIESDNMYIELSDDVVGVQVGATFKNAVGIWIGLVEGASCGKNTEAFVYAKGLMEIRKLGVSLGANPDTFLGLTGAGDLYLRSRSRMLGVEIGKGRDFEEVAKEMVYPKEGIATLRNISNIIRHTGVDLSFFQLAYDVVFNNMKVMDAIKKIK